MLLKKGELEAARKLLNLFKLNGQPAGEIMSDGEVEIFACVAFKLEPRVACVAPTGYGKSEAVAMGAIIRAWMFHEPIIIGSVKYGTSEVIMKKVITHIFDYDGFISSLVIDKGEELLALKMERRKTNITFKEGGSIKIVSLHGADLDVSQAIGEHAPNIILDESPLLSATKYLQTLKILEGTGPYDETFLFELGNAINRNHFMRNVKTNPKYLKIDISLDQAIAEGRLNQESVDEKRGMPYFEQFYECRFPDEDEIDDKGYRQLVTMSEIEKAQVDEIKLDDKKQIRLGEDIGAGGDENTYIMRQDLIAWVEGSNRSNDTMTNVTETINMVESYGEEVKEKDQTVIKPKLLKYEDVFIDDIGVGRGCSDRLIELDKMINAINVGMPSTNPTTYKNIKAENYWKFRLWIKAGGKLLRDLHWVQLTEIKYKINSDKVLQIEPKDELKKRTGHSPDFAEGLMLTFSEGSGVPEMRWLD
jgi:hypothetical protein